MEKTPKIKKSFKIGLALTGVAVIAIAVAVPLALSNKSNDDNKDQHQYNEFDLSTAEGATIKNASQALATTVLGLTSNTGTISSLTKVSKYEKLIQIEGEVTEGSSVKPFICSIELLDTDLTNSKIASFMLDGKSLSTSKSTVDASALNTKIEAFEKVKAANEKQTKVKTSIEAMSTITSGSTTAADAATSITDITSLQTTTGLTVPTEEGTTVTIKSKQVSGDTLNVVFTINVPEATTPTVDTKTITFTGWKTAAQAATEAADKKQSQAKIAVEAMSKTAIGATVSTITAAAVAPTITDLTTFQTITGITVPTTPGATVAFKSAVASGDNVNVVFTIDVLGATTQKVDTNTIAITGWKTAAQAAIEAANTLQQRAKATVEGMTKVVSSTTKTAAEAATSINDLTTFQTITGLTVPTTPGATVGFKSAVASGNNVNVVFTITVPGATTTSVDTSAIAITGWLSEKDALQAKAKATVEAMTKAVSSATKTAAQAAPTITDLTTFKSITGLTIPTTTGATVGFKSAVTSGNNVNVVFTITVAGATTTSIDTNAIPITGWLTLDGLQSLAKTRIEQIAGVATGATVTSTTAEAAISQITDSASFTTITGISVPSTTGTTIRFISSAIDATNKDAINFKWEVTVVGATNASVFTQAVKVTGWKHNANPSTAFIGQVVYTDPSIFDQEENSYSMPSEFKFDDICRMQALPSSGSLDKEVWRINNEIAEFYNSYSSSKHTSLTPWKLKTKESLSKVILTFNSLEAKNLRFARSICYLIDPTSFGSGINTKTNAYNIGTVAAIAPTASSTTAAVAASKIIDFDQFMDVTGIIPTEAITIPDDTTYTISATAGTNQVDVTFVIHTTEVAFDKTITVSITGFA